VIAVDTNVLVRLLVNDPADQRQIELAKTLLREAGQVYVPQIVQVEADFSDCLILAESREQACELASFDRRQGKRHRPFAHIPQPLIHRHFFFPPDAQCLVQPDLHGLAAHQTHVVVDPDSIALWAVRIGVGLC